MEVTEEDDLAYETPDERRQREFDMADLFRACCHLGSVRQEHDVLTDEVVVRFRRDVGEDGREWKRSLTTIRKLLKKYHMYEFTGDNIYLPVRQQLAKMNILRDKLLPMISLYWREECVPLPL